MADAKAGDLVSEKALKVLKGRLRFELPSTVAAKSEGAGGSWVDIDDGYVAAHNMDRDSHAESRPKHRWAWWNRDAARLEAP